MTYFHPARLHPPSTAFNGELPPPSSGCAFSGFPVNVNDSLVKKSLSFGHAGHGSKNQKPLYFPNPQFYDEVVLTPTLPQKIGMGIKSWVVDLPKTIASGLNGDPDFDFGDFLKLGKLPYVLGGSILTLSFLAGRDKISATRQGVGVGLYYLGILGVNDLINKAVKWRYGVDLTMKYRKYTGDIEPIFGSPVFSRYDMIPKSAYPVMMRKMGIPANVADPRGEVHQRIRDLIPAVRVSKSVLGYLGAAVGAGYLARTNLWSRFLEAPKQIKLLFAKESGLSKFDALSKSITVLRNDTHQTLYAQLRGTLATLKTAGFKGAVKSPGVWALGLLTFAGLFSIKNIFFIKPSKAYENANPASSLLLRNPNGLYQSFVTQRMLSLNDAQKKGGH